MANPPILPPSDVSKVSNSNAALPPASTSSTKWWGRAWSALPNIWHLLQKLWNLIFSKTPAEPSPSLSDRNIQPISNQPPAAPSKAEDNVQTSQKASQVADPLIVSESCKRSSLKLESPRVVPTAISIDESQDVPLPPKPIEAPVPVQVVVSPPASPKFQVQDVPADGNCLFYALMVGLKKNCADLPEVQKLLNWNVSPAEIEGNLREKYQGNDAKRQIKELILGPAAQQLRNACAATLKVLIRKDTAKEMLANQGLIDYPSNREQEILKPVLLDLQFNAIGMHNEHIQSQVNDVGPMDILLAQQTAATALQDLLKGKLTAETLKAELNKYPNIRDDFKATHKKIYDKIDSNENLSPQDLSTLRTWFSGYVSNLAREIQNGYNHKDSLDKNLKKEQVAGGKDPISACDQYIERSLATGFQCGPAHIAAASQLYQVNITLWTPNPQAESNSRSIEGRLCQPTTFGNYKDRPTIHIVHVDGNHFKYLHIPRS